MRGEVSLGSKSLFRARIEKVMVNNASNIGRGEITGWSLDLILKSEQLLKDLQDDIIWFCILKTSF